MSVIIPRICVVCKMVDNYIKGTLPRGSCKRCGGELVWKNEYM